MSRLLGAVTNSGTWKISTGARLVWAQLQNLSGNATATNVTLFLDRRRIFGSIDVTAYWDDVLCYRACVPPAPVLSSASSNSLNVDLLPGCNTTLVWQPDATWATKTVTGLATGTPYTFKIQAR